MSILVGYGNKEFSIAAKTIEDKLKAYDLPEVKYFMDVFVSSYDTYLWVWLNDVSIFKIGK